MRILYFDCFSGISGDMILGALVDAGMSLDILKRELAKLPIKGYRLTTRKVIKGSLAATQLSIKYLTAVRQVIHTAQYRQISGVNGNTFQAICSLLNKSKLDDDIKELSKKIFKNLAKAEAEAHNRSIRSVHFHELADLDSIIDIVGFCISIKTLGIDRMYASSLPMGSGIIKTHHGCLPVPAPATLNLLAGSDFQCIFKNAREPIPTNNELVTPTGACILVTGAKYVDSPLPMKISSVGYGAGSRNGQEKGIPNLLRVIIGEVKQSTLDIEGLKTNTIEILEANIDDMNPLNYEYLFDRLFSLGALDVFLTPIQMKKSRPGMLLSILTESSKLNKIVPCIFDETTTFGVRHYSANRFILDRKIRNINTKFGRVRVKIGFLNNRIQSISPEYEDCKAIAKRYNVPFQTVYDEVRQRCLRLRAQILK